MSITDWITATRKECNRWAEYFSVVAGEVDPLAAMDQAKADAWRDFVMENLAAPGQQRMFALKDEPLRNQIGRSMQAIVSLHQRLAQAAATDEASEVSQVMLSIDASLQRLAIAMNRIRPGDVDEEAALPSLTAEAGAGPGAGGDASARDAEPDRQAEPEAGSPVARRSRAGSGSGARPGSGSGARPGSGSGARPGSGSGARPGSGSRPEPRGRAGAGSEPGSGSGARPAARTIPDSEDRITPPERPPPHLQGDRVSASSPAAGPRPSPPPRRRGPAGPGSTPAPRPAGPPPPPEPAGEEKQRDEQGEKAPAERWKPSTTTEDPVIPLTQRKGDSGRRPAPRDSRGSMAAGPAIDPATGPAAGPTQAPGGAGPGAGVMPSPAEPAGAGAFSEAEAFSEAKAFSEAEAGEAAGSGARDETKAEAGAKAEGETAPAMRGQGKGPLRPAATDPRVALLRTYVKRLDREVLGPEEDAALEQVLAILGGALSSDEQTLGRRFRYLDQQYAAEDAALFSAPLLRDLKRLLGKLSERAVKRLEAAERLAQGDRLLFQVGEIAIADDPEALPVVQLARNPAGLRAGLLPGYLPRLRGPSAGFTFHVGSREGAALVRRIPENRLELGLIAGPTRLWLTALHVLRTGERGALNIEPGGDDSPAYFEARLTLPATEETFKVTQRFVLAETARFVDRLATA